MQDLGFGLGSWYEQRNPIVPANWKERENIGDESLNYSERAILISSFQTKLQAFSRVREENI